MLVYRDAERPADTALELDRLDAALSRPSRESALDVLIDAGVLETAVLDALNPDRDETSAAAEAFGALALATGRLHRAFERDEGAAAKRAALDAKRATDRLRALPLPARVTAKTPEGYAWYALYPRAYLAAARRFLAASAPLPAVVVGLRAVGASLSAVVAAELEAAGRKVERVTLRPRGEPFDRRPLLGPRLTRRLERPARADAWFLIVDEGPGLSGSSFVGTAAALEALGADESQIVLMPSVATDGRGLNNAEARRRWGRLRKETARFERPGALIEARDVSGGLWRSVVCGRTRPPVAPQHERRKYLDRSGVLHRFAGLGRVGRERFERARRLGEAGFTPEPISFADGFLAGCFVEGRPMRRRDRDAEFDRTVAAYLGWLGREARTGAPADPEPLFALLERNTELALGRAGLDRLAGLDAWRARLAGAPAVAVDGRLSPHEWILTADGPLKTDAIDHHDDHFFPGPAADLAWDVAGFAAEWDLSARETADLAAAVAAEAGDPGLAARLPFHQSAYLAFRTGLTALSAQSMPDGADRRGLELQARLYRTRLSRSLERLAAA